MADPPEPGPFHPDVLPAGWARAADALASRSVLEGFYLAGGTGLALQFGHRRSADLDLFRYTEFDAVALRDRLRDLDGLAALEIAPRTMHLQLHGVKVSFLHYPYPELFPLRPFGRLAVADARDIACMKLDAIAHRGSRRDFVDLYVAGSTYGLAEIVDWFARKYSSVPYSRTHLFKALTYFVDAEREPMPDMLVSLEWTNVRAYFLTQAPRLPRLSQ
jgi:hypothetical protein